MSSANDGLRESHLVKKITEGRGEALPPRFSFIYTFSNKCSRSQELMTLW